MQAPLLEAEVEAADREQGEAGLPEQPQRITPATARRAPAGLAHVRRPASSASVFPTRHASTLRHRRGDDRLERVDAGP